MYKEKIIDLITGEETWRDYTEEEIALVKQAQNKAAEEAKKEAEIVQERLAILTKLGITEEEAKLLFS